MTSSQFVHIVIPSSAIGFTASFTMTFLASYLPEMTVWLGDRERDKGYYVGFVTASYYVGAFTTNYAFCWLPGKLGLRNVVMLLLIAGSIYALAFSFSNHYGLIVVFRFLMGTCDSLIPLSLTILSNCTNETQGTLMSVTVMAGTLGIHLGAGVGGYLATPVVKYPSVFSGVSFFASFPYFLPPFLASLLYSLTAIVVFLLYQPITNITDEDNIPINNAEFPIPNYHSLNLHAVGNGLSTEEISKNDDVNDPTTLYNCAPSSSNKKRRGSFPDTMENSHDIMSSKLKKASSPLDKTIYQVIKLRIMNNFERCKCLVIESTFITLLKNVDIVKVLAAGILLYVGGMSFSEISALWESTDKQLGGLRYSTTSIGTALTMVMIPCLCLHMLITPLLTRKIGAIRLLVLNSLLFTVPVTLVPLCRLLRDDKIKWIVVIISQGIVSFTEMSGTVCTGIITNNSVPPEQVSVVNGLVRSGKNFFKTFYSMMAGSVFAATITSTVGSPVDVSLVFFIIGVTIWLCAIIACCLPSRFDHKPDTAT